MVGHMGKEAGEREEYIKMHSWRLVGTQLSEEAQDIWRSTPAIIVLTEHTTIYPCGVTHSCWEASKVFLFYLTTMSMFWFIAYYASLYPESTLFQEHPSSWHRPQ